MATLSLRELIKFYKGRKVVDSVSLDLDSGQVAGLLGPNGAGKTTTFYMAVGFVKADSGQVLINKDDITNKPMHQRARKGIGYLPQEASIFRKLSVEQDLTAVLEYLNYSQAEQKEHAARLLEEMGIAHLAEQMAQSLSGGERRRLEIARVLATKPAFILLDEPFAGIDPMAVADLQKIIADLTKRDIGILISDHNVRETLSVCHHAYILNKGQIIEAGPPDHIANSEIARRIYLGEEFKF